ncbi:MAG: hypothetical protein C0425_08175 [Chlorobiaceae bacterium]|nr:hypothetical protein [Chlorobiaceae bacterium]MBA4310298.1 hypothetical protein [Chlorobiaceae bacterium]
MKNSWIKTVERDVLALGGVVFYFLVIGRALIEPYLLLLIQLGSAALILAAVYFFYKNFDTYLARAIILIVGTGLFYNSIAYSSFTLLIFVFMIFASIDLGTEKKKVIAGIVVGVIATIFAVLIGQFAEINYAVKNY